MSATGPMASSKEKNVESASISGTYSMTSKSSVQNVSGSITTSRERSSTTKSQQVQFLKLNEKNYLNETFKQPFRVENAENTSDTNESSASDTESKSTVITEMVEYEINQDEVKNDLLFRPSTTDLR